VITCVAIAVTTVLGLDLTGVLTVFCLWFFLLLSHVG